MVMGLLSNRRPAGAPAPAAPIVNTPQALTQMRGIGTEKHLLAKRAHDDTQLKVFTRWWAAELPTSHALPEGGLAQAISDGVAGIVLLEQLTKTPFKPGSFHADPAGNRIKIIENHNTFLDRVKELGVQLTNISAEDLADGKQTLVLGSPGTSSRTFRTASATPAAAPSSNRGCATTSPRSHPTRR